MTASFSQLKSASPYLSLPMAVEVVVPSSWKRSSCQPGRRIVSMSMTRGEKADILITDAGAGGAPWTLQARGCGLQGERINIPHSFLLFNSSELGQKSEEMAREWAKYRYGVFEESGFPQDPVYPPRYSEGNETVVNTGCEALGGIFCGGSYNRYAPTKQNILCQGRSAWETILARQEETQHSVAPVFSYVSLPPSEYVLVLDLVHEQDMWVSIKHALYRMIDLLPEGSMLSIVTVGEEAALSLPPTVITEGKREGLKGRIPRRGVEGVEGCVVCGVELAMETLGSASIVIVSSGAVTPPVKNRVFSIAYSKNTSESRAHAVYHAHTTASLTEAFIDVLNTLETDQVQKIYESQHQQLEFSGAFYVEENTRTEVTVTLSIDDEQKVENFEVKDPSGKRNIFSKFEDGFVIFRFPGKSDSGIWTYSAKLYEDTSLPARKMTIDVTARSEGKGVTVTTMGSVTEDKDHNQIILVDIKKGNNPVVGASVTAKLSGPGGSMELALRDTGLGYPDITRGDGVYSAYVPVFATHVGYHQVEIRAENGGNGRVYRPDTSTTGARCCGSQMVSNEGDPTGKFHRFVNGPSVFIRKSNPLKKDLTPPSRISDFRVLSTNTTTLRLSFAWTAPGGDLDGGEVVRYEIRCHPQASELSDRYFPEKGILVHPREPIAPAPYLAPQAAEAGIPWTNERFYYAITSYDKAGNMGPVSNLVTVYIPEEVHTTTPPPSSLHVREPGSSYGAGSWLLDTHTIFIIAGGAGGVLLVITIFVIIMLFRARKDQQQQKKKKEVLDTYEAGFYPDIKISKTQTKTSSDGVYNWLDTLPPSEHSSSNKSTASRQKAVTDGSALDLCCDEGSSCSRPTTSTDDSISNHSDNKAQCENTNSTKTSANKSSDPHLSTENQSEYSAQHFSRSKQHHSCRAPAYSSQHRYAPCGDSQAQGFATNSAGWGHRKKRHESVV